jgi:hypothetical protein
VSDPVGAEAGKEGGYIVGIRYGESAVGAVVLEGEAKESGGKRMGFGVVESRQAGDKESKVRGVVVLHTEVVHHQDKSDRSRGMTEKTGSEGLMEVE